jgi:endonuclease III
MGEEANTTAVDTHVDRVDGQGNWVARVPPHRSLVINRVKQEGMDALVHKGANI